MVVQLPSREFYTLPEIAEDWKVTPAQLWQCLMSGDLIGHVRVPLICAFALQENEGHRFCIRKTVTTWEGFAQITRFQCQRLYENGQLLLREFICERGVGRYVLPDEADDLIVTEKRFGILGRERIRFESLYGHDKSKDSGRPAFDPSFRSLRFRGEDYYFGAIQAAILKRLYEASRSDQPWLSGKALLHEVGSESFSLMSLFRRHPLAKELIVSDKRGFYRLSDHIHLME